MRGYLASAFRVFDLSIGEMLWSRRTIFMALVAGAPVCLAAAVRLLDAGGAVSLRADGVALEGPAIFGMMLWVFFLRFAVPVLGVFYGTAIIADEVEERTITYLFTRPIPRGAILLGKYLASLVCTTLVVLPAAMIVYFLVVPLGAVPNSFGALVLDLLVLAVGLAVYGAVFALAGAVLTRPLVVGLLFAFGWEPLALVLPGYLNRLTVASYLQALVPHTMPSPDVAPLLQAVVRDAPAAPIGILALGLILAASLGLGMRAVERREYVLEQ